MYTTYVDEQARWDETRYAGTGDRHVYSQSVVLRGLPEEVCVSIYLGAYMYVCMTWSTCAYHLHAYIHACIHTHTYHTYIRLSLSLSLSLFLSLSLSLSVSLSLLSHTHPLSLSLSRSLALSLARAPSGRAHECTVVPRMRK